MANCLLFQYKFAAEILCDIIVSRGLIIIGNNIMQKIFMLCAMLFCFAANADDINYKSIEDAGFGQVSDVLKDMTPEQRAHLEREAENMLPELKAMTPSEIAELTQQLKEIQNTIDASTIDAKKLDTTKIKSFGETQKDLDTYMQHQR